MACDLGGGCGDIAGCHCWVPGVLATCWVPFGCHLPCIGSYGWMPIFVRSLGATLGGVMLGCHVEALWGGVFLGAMLGGIGAKPGWHVLLLGRWRVSPKGVVENKGAKLSREQKLTDTILIPFPCYLVSNYYAGICSPRCSEKKTR